MTTTTQTANRLETETIKQEIQHYIAFCALKKLFEQGEIEEQRYRKAAVALAENYSVLPYSL